MKYYYHPISPNCRKTTALISHLGIDAEKHVVDLPKGEHMRPEFLAINPNGRVPALQDGDVNVWESNSIIIYLADKAGSDLWPADERRYDILRWMFWEQGHLMYAAGIPFFQRLIKPMIGEEPDEARIEEALKNFRRLAKVLDDHLAGQTYLVGDRLTLADWAVASHLSYAGPSGLPVDEFCNVQRWLATLDETPAWKESEPPPMGS